MTLTPEDIERASRLLADQWSLVSVRILKALPFTPKGLFGEPIDAGFISVVEVSGCGRAHRYCMQHAGPEADVDWTEIRFRSMFILDQSADNMGRR